MRLFKHVSMILCFSVKRFQNIVSASLSVIYHNNVTFSYTKINIIPSNIIDSARKIVYF